MQDITAWLHGSQHYNDGVKLYSKYGKSSFLKTLFANGPTPFNIKKLAAELMCFAPTPPAKNNEFIVQEIKKEINATPTISDAKNHRIYLELKEEQKKKYRQLDRNMALLDFETKPNILHLTAKNIMHLYAGVQKIHHLLDFYDLQGCFPDQEIKTPAKTDAIQLLQSAISKAKTRLKKNNCRDRAKTEKLLSEKTKLLEELKQTINE